MNKEIMGLLVLKGGDEPGARESGRGEASSVPLADDSGRASQSSASQCRLVTGLLTSLKPRLGLAS